MTDTALLAALRTLEGVLAEEAKESMSEGLAARKDAAIASVQALLTQGLAFSPEDTGAVAERLQALLVANRFSLKWNGLRAELARLGQPKAPSPVNRPRVDLVH